MFGETLNFTDELCNELCNENFSRCLSRFLRLDAVAHLSSSVAVLAEISLRSPRKLFIFIIKQYIFRIKVSKKQFNLILKEASLVPQTGKGLSMSRWMGYRACHPHNINDLSTGRGYLNLKITAKLCIPCQD